MRGKEFLKTLRSKVSSLVDQVLLFFFLFYFLHCLSSITYTVSYLESQIYQAHLIFLNMCVLYCINGYTTIQVLISIQNIL